MADVWDQVNATSLLLYLRTAGWVETPRSDPRRSIWLHRSGLRVFVPGRAGPDNHDLLRMAVERIAEAEERPEEDVAMDVAWQTYDRLQAHREAEPSGLAFDDALDLHESVRDVIVAAARSSTEPRPSYHGRRPLLVQSYLDEVRVIPSKVGSFVVRALLPLNLPSMAQEPLPMVGPIAPSIRAVSTTIISAAGAAVGAAADVAGGAPFSVWDTVVPAGVSANMCDALSRLTGTSDSSSRGNVDLRIHWTWIAPSDGPSSVVHVPAGLSSVLAAGGDYLREQPEEHTIRMTGLITKLHRESATGPGEITVRGHIQDWDAGSRALRFEVDEVSYRRAIASHDSGTSVRVVALVRRTPRGLEVLRVEDLAALSS